MSQWNKLVENSQLRLIIRRNAFVLQLSSETFNGNQLEIWRNNLLNILNFPSSQRQATYNKHTLILFLLNTFNYKLSTAQEIKLNNNCIHLYNLTLINTPLKHTMLIFKEGLSRDVWRVPLRGDFAFCAIARK